MFACWTFTRPPCVVNYYFTRWGSRGGFCCKARTSLTDLNNLDHAKDKKRRKVVIVGSGWAGLGAAHHLCNQGFEVTVLEDSNGFGGPDTVGIQGFWYPYKNIFNLVDELGIKPFTNWVSSAQYSMEGLEVEFPVFQDLPQLPTPFGPLFYTRFFRISLLDRLTSLPLMAAGSYKHMMRGSTSFPNLFVAGDWIKTRHGSWGQEKSYVTGLEAANRVVDFLGDGNFAKIIPVEEDEPHIQALRSLNRSFNEIRTQLPFSGYFLQ